MLADMSKRSKRKIVMMSSVSCIGVKLLFLQHLQPHLWASPVNMLSQTRTAIKSYGSASVNSAATGSQTRHPQ